MGRAVRPSADSLLRQLAGRGYSIFSFSVASTGDYAVADADWNYKDIPHLNVVHTQVRGILATIDDDMVTNIFLQRVAGIPLPIVVVNYAESDVAQSYFTSFGPYVLVVRTQYEAEGPNRTKVTTTYNIAASGIWRLGLPLLKRILTKNYHTLMSEDTPMRDRRGELRARGFRFRTDGSPRAFPETAHLTIDNLIVPERTEASAFRVQL